MSRSRKKLLDINFCTLLLITYIIYNCYFFICDWIHIFFRKHGFRDHRQRRGREKVDYGEGIAMTGFYFALKGDNGANMA